MLTAGILFFIHSQNRKVATITETMAIQATAMPSQSIQNNNNFPLAIAAMRQKSYPGSDIIIEQTLTSGVNYNRFLVSYLSDGLKIYGLLTVPIGQKPFGGWPIILFNHGYIPPSQYSTESSYDVLANPIASAGYIVFKPDYRGNGNSQGKASQIYVSPDYVTDSLNALASVKKYKDADPNKIGVLGHSMGGNITIHELVISKDIKAAVILSGVVGSYTDILKWWNTRVATGVLTTQNDQETALLVKQFTELHGTPQTNPTFWQTIDPTTYISDITAPVQIQVGTEDEDVPPSFSTSLRDELQSAGKTVDFHEYLEADHNLSPDTSEAIVQALSFLHKYLK